MNEIASEFSSRGAAAERQLNEVLDRTEARNRKLSAISDFEEAWEDAVEDGRIDESEMAQIAAAAGTAGIDQALVARLRTAAGNGAPLSPEEIDALGDRVENAARRGRSSANDGSLILDLERNLLISEVQNNYQAASNVLKVEHDTLMSAIRNLIA